MVRQQQNEKYLQQLTGMGSSERLAVKGRGNSMDFQNQLSYEAFFKNPSG